MTTQQIICKYCHNTAVVKYGTFEGMQRYFCKSCRRKFADNDALPKMKTPIWVIASALGQYYDGKSLATIQEYLNKRYGAIYAKSSIYNWVIRFSREAINLTCKFQPAIGKIWLACETSFTVGKHKIWLWDVIDSGNSYLLDSSLCLERVDFNAKLVNEAIHRKTGVLAEVIFTVKSGDNGKSTESVWYKSSKDAFLQKTSMMEENVNTTNRFLITLKTRKAVLRGYKNIETAHLLVATWQIHYNFFKSFTTIGHIPPAQSMENPPFRNWIDLINNIKYKNNPPAVSLLKDSRLTYLQPESLKELPLKGKYT